MQVTRIKRFMATLLAMVMVMGMMPTSAFAIDGGEPSNVTITVTPDESNQTVDSEETQEIQVNPQDAGEVPPSEVTTSPIDEGQSNPVTPEGDVPTVLPLFPDDEEVNTDITTDEEVDDSEEDLNTPPTTPDGDTPTVLPVFPDGEATTPPTTDTEVDNSEEDLATPPTTPEGDVPTILPAVMNRIPNGQHNANDFNFSDFTDEIRVKIECECDDDCKCEKDHGERHYTLNEGKYEILRKKFDDDEVTVKVLVYLRDFIKLYNSDVGVAHGPEDDEEIFKIEEIEFKRNHGGEWKLDDDDDFEFEVICSREQEPEPTYVSFTIKKVDSENKNTLLSGAEFTVYSDKDCQNAITTVTTNQNGKAIVENLEAGKTYYMKETTAPNGYTASETVYTIKTTADKNDKSLIGKILEFLFGDKCADNFKDGVLTVENTMEDPTIDTSAWFFIKNDVSGWMPNHPDTNGTDDNMLKGNVKQLAIDKITGEFDENNEIRYVFTDSDSLNNYIETYPDSESIWNAVSDQYTDCQNANDFFGKYEIKWISVVRTNHPAPSICPQIHVDGIIVEKVQNTYTVKIDADKGVDNNNGAGTYNKGDNATVTFTLEDGYKLDQVFDNVSNEYKDITDGLINEDGVYSYTINDIQTNHEIQIKTTKIPSATEASYTVNHTYYLVTDDTTELQYDQKSISYTGEDGQEINAYDVVNIIDDFDVASISDNIVLDKDIEKSIDIVYKRYQYTVAVKTDAGVLSNTNGDSKTYDKGTDVTVEFDLHDGYKISQVLIDNVDVTSQVLDNKIAINDLQAHHDVEIKTEKIATEPTTSTSYTVKHEYYANNSLEYTDTKTLTGNVGNTVLVDDSIKQVTYNGTTYNFTSASPSELVLVADAASNVITLRYDRTYSTGGGSSSGSSSGGGGGGGTTTPPTDPDDGTDIDEPDVPLVENPDGETDIDEPDVPLVENPDGETDGQNPDVEIPEEETPLIEVPEVTETNAEETDIADDDVALANLPQTGLVANEVNPYITLGMILLTIILLSAGFVYIMPRKYNDD